jgi:hypothetical protein
MCTMIARRCPEIRYGAAVSKQAMSGGFIGSSKRLTSVILLKAARVIQSVKSPIEF